MVRLKKYLVRFFLLLASCCFALLVLEGVVRVFFPHVRDHVLPGRLFDIDEHLGWKLKAGKQVVHHTSYFKVVYTTNSLGFRDQPRHGSKNNNVYRVLLYGDSQIFGWGVSEDRRFSNLIARCLPSVELWNLAVPAYGLDQQILSYERNGESLDGDEVIFFVSERTLNRSHRDYMSGKYKPVFVRGENGALRLIPPRHVYKTRWLYEILSPMYFPHFVNRRLKMLQAIIAERIDKKDQGTRDDALISGRRIGDFDKDLLHLARNTAVERKQNITVLVALPNDMRKDLRDFAERYGIGFLAINFDHVRQNLELGRHDHHWNPQAHQLIAEQILSQVDWELVRKKKKGDQKKHFSTALQFVTAQ